jgi:nitrous oxidase accessory protein NosD
MIGIQVALVLGVLVATSTSYRLAVEAPQVEVVKRKRRRKPVTRKKPVVVPAGLRLVVDNTAP